MLNARYTFALAALATMSCAAPATSELGSSADEIVAGKKATAFPEAALIDASDFICSGAVIAPRVVLTAGHCVVGASSWKVTAPYANRQTARARKSWTAYEDGGDSVNPDTNDVAVIVLDTPIVLSKYPTLAKSAVPSGTKAVNVGRIQNDRASSTDLFVGGTVTLRPGSSEGWRFAYISREVIEEGDSGGPVFTTGGSRTLVGVNSGGGGGTQLLARVDLAYEKIQSIIRANGGPGDSTSSDAGVSSDAGATGVTGGCFSQTLGVDVEEQGCVQSSANRIWFQCHEGAWYRGGDESSGPFGTCTSSHPL